MRILNFGSLNIDYVHRVDHIARPGETIAGRSLDIFAGGKGAKGGCRPQDANARKVHDEGTPLGHDKDSGKSGP